MKDEIKKYEIRDITQMPKPPEVEVHTMDVYGHLDKREQKIKEIMKQSSNPRDEYSSQNTKKSDNSMSDFDLQKELEKKFDELFGDDNED